MCSYRAGRKYIFYFSLEIKNVFFKMFGRGDLSNWGCFENIFHNIWRLADILTNYSDILPSTPFCWICSMYFAFTVYISGTGIVHGRIQLKKNPSIFECTSMHKSVKFSNTFLKQALISNIYSNGWSDCHVDCQTLLNAAKTKSIIHCLFVSLVTKSIFFF